MTLYTSRGGIKYIFENTRRANNNIQDFSPNINKVLKEGFWNKNAIINFYGLGERFLGRRASNDRIYYRDSSNIMHIDRGIHDFTSFYKDNAWLSNYCKEKNIPYLVVQVPEKGQYGDEYSKKMDKECTTNYIEKLRTDVFSNDDLYIDSFELFKKHNLEDKNIFFKSDFHCTTLAELTELEEIIKVLQSKGVNFYNSQNVLDFENSNLYEKTTRNFVGNLSNQYGKFYVGVDDFVFYIPKFETNMQRINKEGKVYKSGDFRNSMLNGLLEDGKNWKYFVTDFLNWPEPYYEINNNLAEHAPSILVFIDSQSMRAVTYLSLMCNNVTVLDPRYFNEDNNYFDKIKNNVYDAVITFATCDLWRGLTYESELSSKTNGGEVLNCLVFLLCLFFPLLFLSLKSADISVKEKRNLASFPVLRENNT